MTRNQIRYIDKDTIEVKLTNDQIMKIDAKYLNKVQLYPLQAKPKKEKNKISFYVLYQNKKIKTGRFIDLIGDYKILQFKNGNTLDLRECNIKEFGAVDKVQKTQNISNEIISKQYDYFNTLEKYLPQNLSFLCNLPKNIWLLGKPMGTIFKRSSDNNIWNVRVDDENGNQHTKTFNIAENYNNNNNLAFIAAKKWQIETSYKLAVTKNLIKIIDADTIEVQITKNNIFKTNRIFIPLIQTIPIFTLTSGNSIIYAYCCVNLRPATISMNNSNRHFENIEPENYGVTRIKTIFGNSYRAHIKLEGSEYSKYFSVNKFTEEEAKKMAQEFRKKLSKCINIHKDVTEDDDFKLIQFLTIKLKYIIDHTKKSIIYNDKNYLKNINISDELKKEIHKYYLYNMFLYNYNNLRSYDILKNLIIQKALQKK